MKKNLIDLIEAIPTIEAKFKKFEPSDGLCLPPGEFIYDNPEFIEWREAVEFELQEIHDRTHDSYIWNIINENGVIHKFNGKSYSERNNFNKLKSSLLVIQRNLNKYYPAESEESDTVKMLKSKLFVSHASADKKYVKPFVELLADIGMTKDNLFCSSIPDYAIPLNQDIYDYLADLFRHNKLYVLFMLSNNYYASSVSLNEMGAAWVLKNEYTTILLPGFEYKEIKGAVNPNKIGVKFDDEDEQLKVRLGELKNIISKEFGISVPDMRWEKKRNDFIETIKKCRDKGGDCDGEF